MSASYKPEVCACVCDEVRVTLLTLGTVLGCDVLSRSVLRSGEYGKDDHCEDDHGGQGV